LTASSRAAPRGTQQPDRPRFNKVRFDGATFEDRINFRGATFGEWAGFDGATFGDEVSFDDTTFGDRAGFVGARFGNLTSFAGATLGDWARLDRARFGDKATFVGATFGNLASFGGATFGDLARFGGRASFGDGASFADASFGNGAGFDGTTFGEGAGFDRITFGHLTSFGSATFGDRASFANAIFRDLASFAGVIFGDRASFARATFGDQASFVGTSFGHWAGFGPLLVSGRLSLVQAVFAQGPELTISADLLDCEGMRLSAGGALNVRWAEVWLDGTDFGHPSVLAGVDPVPGLSEDSLRPRAAQPWRTERPRVVSLRGSDVRNLVLSNVDLRACRFAGAHNLDQLRFEASIDLADRPTGLRSGFALPPLWRWTRRHTLAEEHRWRRARRKHAGWYPRICQVQGLAEYEHVLPPADIVRLYRALRKGREDSKDEPGAADFYYGEMEMRCHDHTAPWPEPLVLWLYWLVAGYGLRASRALGWLLGVLAVATVMLATVGFASPSATPVRATITGTPPQQRIRFETEPPTMTVQPPLADRLGTAALVAVEGAVFRTSDQALTYKGRLLQATLRFVGPVLLGLALLSIRGRVKR
jgi:hypothetical protein